MKTRIVAVLLISAVALLALSTEALALDIKYTGLVGGSADGYYYPDAANPIGGGGGGAFTLVYKDDDDVEYSFIGFCIELTNSAPSSYLDDYSLVWPAIAPHTNGDYGAMGAAGEAALNRLFGTQFYVDANNDGWTDETAYAFQLAVWEIVYEYAYAYENGLTIDDVSLGTDDGRFTLDDSSTEFGTAADAAAILLGSLGDVAVDDIATTYALTSTNRQDYVFGVHTTTPFDDPPPPAVPLPPAALGGLFLLGGLAAARRRRKSHAE